MLQHRRRHVGCSDRLRALTRKIDASSAAPTLRRSVHSSRSWRSPMQRKYSLLMRGGVLAAALCAPSFLYADTGEKKGAPAEAREKSRDAQQPVRIEAPLPAQTITAVQQALAARNLYQGKVDGVWGAKTESALRN